MIVNTQEVEPIRKGLSGTFSGLASENLSISDSCDDRPTVNRMDSTMTNRRHSSKSRLLLSSGQLPRRGSKNSRQGLSMSKKGSNSSSNNSMKFYVDQVKNISEEIRATRRRSSYGSAEINATQRRTSYSSTKSSDSALSQDFPAIAQLRRSSSKSFQSFDSIEDFKPKESRRSYSGESIGSLARKLSYLSTDSIPVVEINCLISQKNPETPAVSTDHGESLRSLALKLSKDLEKGEPVQTLKRKLSRESSQHSVLGSGDGLRTLKPRRETATTA